MRAARCKKKPGRMGRALHSQNNTAYTQSLLRRSGLRDISLERLVGLLGEIGVELAHLGGLRDKAFIRRLRIVGLDPIAFSKDFTPNSFSITLVPSSKDFFE